MSQLNLSNPETIAKEGERIYKETLKEQLEKDNIGKFLAIEVETGDYFIDDSLEEALKKAKEKYSKKLFYLMRIGFSGIYNVSWTSTNGNNWFL
jgi:hypothetical protein